MFGLDKLLKVIDPEPVLIDQQACLRSRHIRSACRACSDICPENAFGFEDRKLTVDPALCSRCGLCLGACPTAALQVRGVDESQFDGALEVRCAHAPGDGVALPCLGALSPDHIVDLGSRRPGVALVAGDCAACPMARGGERARASLAAAVETLSALGHSELPVWRTKAEAAAPEQVQAVSRRDLLALWGRSAVQTGRSLLPDREVNPVKLPAKVPARRLRWLKRFAAPEHDGRMRWPTRQVAAGCIACNICVAFCPTGALVSREGEDRTWTLSLQTVACVDCGTCMQLCPRSLISPGEGPQIREVLSGARTDLVTVPGDQRPVKGARPW
ncbi:MAG TPA: 4Fe-4S dicluster domain-containing protein [Symbiobacteriaceae bacterium]|nr:4Fe-4S dicluster domain-containing protein [Symbiobacteriaceae bacterium]